LPATGLLPHISHTLDILLFPLVFYLLPRNGSHQTQRSLMFSYFLLSAETVESKKTHSAAGILKNPGMSAIHHDQPAKTTRT